MNNRETLIHAAELLEREATVLIMRYVSHGAWSDPDAKDDHDDMLATARALRVMAENNLFGPGCV